MTNIDYRADIESAKTTPDYFKPFEAFTIRRVRDTVSIDTTGKSTLYPLDLDTEALNRGLNRLRKVKLD